MRVAIVDTYYPDFLATLPKPSSYESGLEYALSRFFGTHSAYSRGLQGYGWEAIDILGNYTELRRLKLELPWTEIQQFNPDVVFTQDLSYFSVEELIALKTQGRILAGQCSCRFDDDEILKQFDVLFTSFPFYVDRFNKLGVHGVFLPLAFDPLVLERSRIPESRTHAVSFVGGYGRHWQMDDLFVRLANETPIQFWGYGFENAPPVVRSKWRGPAWGLDMYEVYLRSHIVVNRHGAIAGGFSNNLRMFEATGCGAMLMTEASPNLSTYFKANEECVPYVSANQCIEQIHYYLDHPELLRKVASAGQERTLSRHTYAQRMSIVSEVLKEHLSRKAA